jgi:hypothetical protein
MPSLDRPASPPATRLSAPFAAWGWPIVVALIGMAWWDLMARQLRSAGMIAGTPHGAGMLRLAVALALLARCAAAALESGTYALWWRASGRRLPFAALFGWTLMLSSFDLLAAHLRRLCVHYPLAAAPGALLVGAGVARAARGAPPDAFAASFGGLGLLALARIVATAHVQREMLGVSLARTLARVAVAWLITHLGQWWLLDLGLGRIGR